MTGPDAEVGPLGGTGPGRRSTVPPATLSRAERRLLRWYPAAWVDRYGGELMALVEDGGEAPSRRVRTELMVAGGRERLRQAALIGSDRPPADRTRAGVALVLAGWAALVVAGAMFAKTTEHWTDGVSAGRRNVADAAFGLVALGAAIGALAVIAAVVAMLPALRRRLLAGGWRGVLRPVLVALALSLVGVGATVGLAGWAHHLTEAPRNGGSDAYSTAFLAWGLLAVTIVAAWAWAGIRVERWLEPGTRVVRVEWAAASVVGLATAMVTAAMLVWWVAMAVDLPWVLHGAPSGSPSSGFAWNIAVAALVALFATVVATAGLARLVAGRRIWASPTGTP